jgi:hypothetical protein
MRSFRIVLGAGVLVAAVLALGILLGWFGSHQGPPEVKPIAEISGQTNVTSAGVDRPGVFKKRAPSRAAETGTDASTATNLMADWEDKMEEVFDADIDTTEMAKRFLDLLPKFPPAGQKEVVEHLSNLLDDEDYPRLGQYLTNASMSPLVLDALMTDAMDRPDSMKLPLFLEVARNADHPKASEAKETLEMYLDEYVEPDEELGDNWALWETKLQEYLKDNPD